MMREGAAEMVHTPQPQTAPRIRKRAVRDVSPEERQQKSAAGKVGGYKRAAFRTHAELSERGKHAVEMQHENAVLATRPDIANNPAELARMALSHLDAHMQKMRNARAAKKATRDAERLRVDAERVERAKAQQQAEVDQLLVMGQLLQHAWNDLRTVKRENAELYARLMSQEAS